MTQHTATPDASVTLNPDELNRCVTMLDRLLLSPVLPAAQKDEISAIKTDLTATDEDARPVA